MTLEVNKNSYVTLEEASQYIGTLYSGPIAETWEEKTQEEKELLLIIACDDLDSLPFTGRATHRGQELMFPRHPNTEVPDNVKYAQIEIAIAPLKPDTVAQRTEASRRRSLQAQGVKSFSIDDLSESYTEASGSGSGSLILLDEMVARYLSRYLQGGYAIC